MGLGVWWRVKRVRDGFKLVGQLQALVEVDNELTTCLVRWLSEEENTQLKRFGKRQHVPRQTLRERQRLLQGEKELAARLVRRLER